MLGATVLVGAAVAFASPKLVPIGPVEMVWDQDVDACPGKNLEGHVGEQPDSMPLAWHNPVTNRTSLISANDWGTFAKVAASLGALGSGKGQADCSHRVYTSVNSSDPAAYASHQWMQSVHVYPNGSGFSLIHSEFHGDFIDANASLCSYSDRRAPHGECQLWSTALGVTADGGEHWTLAGPPPTAMVFATPRRYVKDQVISGFGALGALLELDGYYYGHVNQILAGTTGNDPNTSGVCAFRTRDQWNPRSFRGWNGSHWAASWVDPYTATPHGLATGDHTCAVVGTGAPHNGHPNPRKFAGSWMPQGAPGGWPSHVMLGWPEGSENVVSYAFPGWVAGSPAPFTAWEPAQLLDITGWCPPGICAGQPLMYPALLDADSPFGLGKNTAEGLSYSLVGNDSLAVYFVVARKNIARLPVAWVAAGTPPPPMPFPPPPPSPLNPAGCTAFEVAGAGEVAVNGLYKLASNTTTTSPIFSKDADHQLYHFGAHWKLAHRGVGPTYYTAADTHGGGKRVPVTSWAGLPPFPTVTCTTTAR